MNNRERPSTLAIEARSLSKTFDDQRGWRFWRPAETHTAVKNVSLEVARGELFGLLGPNGAGKTTLVKMVCTLILPTAGEATVLGYPLSSDRAIRQLVGLTVTDERSFYWRLTGRQNLRFFAALHGLFGAAAETRINTVLRDVDLEEAAARRFSGYSTGMRQRLSIARALLAEPELLILDEPSRSLDPVATQRLHDLILRLQSERDLTVFLITHDLAEAEKLCRRVAVMAEGRLVVQGTPADIRARLSPKISYTIEITGLSLDFVDKLIQMDQGITVRPVKNGAIISLAAEKGDERLDRVLQMTRAGGGRVGAIHATQPSLDEAFQQLVVS